MLLLEMTVVVMYKILLLRLSEVGEQSIWISGICWWLGDNYQLID
jgi:hypothetical protein